MVKRKKGLISTLFDLAEVEELSPREGAQEFLKRERKREKKARRRRKLLFKLRAFGLVK